jgi:hypothetical protein
MHSSNGLLLASTAAALFASGACLAGDTERSGTEALVHCAGINACQGTTECKSAANACKGRNRCAKAGWIATTRADCEAKGGKAIK